MPYQTETTAAKTYGIARTALICAALLIVPGAEAGFLNPLSTTVGVNGPDAIRNTNGTGPISDSESSSFGLSTVDLAAAVDAFGLHVSAIVHADASTPGYAASGAAYAGIANPFIIVPNAGFVGTQVLIQIPYSFSGSIDLFPSLAACPTCFGDVNASLGVDGMPNQFSFSGVRSLGTINNPTFMASNNVALSGVLVGLVPVNTELYLRGSLLLRALCQSGPSCSVDNLFGGSLSFTALSPDPVTFDWGLTPVLESAPEPAGFFLLGGGLLGVAAVRNRRRKGC